VILKAMQAETEKSISVVLGSKAFGAYQEYGDGGFRGCGRRALSRRQAEGKDSNRNSARERRGLFVFQKMIRFARRFRFVWMKGRARWHGRNNDKRQFRRQRK